MPDIVGLEYHKPTSLEGIAQRAAACKDCPAFRTSTGYWALASRSKSFASLRIWTPPLECKREARSA
jgi:hypothetical protein